MWSREAQREDADAASIWNGNGGICVAQNVASEAEVGEVMAMAEDAGSANPKAGCQDVLGWL